MLTTKRPADVGIGMSRLIEADRTKEVILKKKTGAGARDMRVQNRVSDVLMETAMRAIERPGLRLFRV